MSFADTDVVHPVKVVLCFAVPVEMAGSADAVMVLVTVGTAVPFATFQTSTVIVPPSIMRLHAEIVQENGTDT